VVVGADLGDPAVAEPEPLGAAVEALLTGLRVAPGHRPLDHSLVAVGDPVLVVPLAVEVVDRPARVLRDRPPVMGAEAGVVVSRVVGEMGRDQLDVAGVERLVVAADVAEVRDPKNLSRNVDFRSLVRR
jgi:hypothetical protein